MGRRAIGVAGNVVFTLVALLLGGTILALTILPPILRYQTYVVLSGSMEPTIPVGAVVVATAVDPNALQIGDIITFVRPGDQENVTHRIVGIHGGDQGRTFVTKGDANGVTDQGEIRFDHLAGKVTMSIPYLGYVFKFIGSPTMRLLFIVVPGMLLLATWLWEIWRPQSKARPAAEEALPGMAPAPVGPAAAAMPPDIELGVAPDAATVPLRQ